MRFTLLALLLWGLLGAPTLCLGGVLLHPCECATTIECDHEEVCDDDPCVNYILPVGAGSFAPATAIPTAILPFGIDLLPAPPRVKHPRQTVPEALGRDLLPYPPDALPLRN